MSVTVCGVGNGIADDTAAFVIAQDKLPERGGQIVVPEGEYRITSDIVPRARVRWLGEGREASVIVADGCNGFVHEPATDPGPNGPRSMSFADLGLRGDYTAGKSGIRMAWSHWWQMDRVMVSGFGGPGIVLHDTYVNSIRDSLIADNDGAGVSIGQYTNALTLDGNEIRRNNGAGVSALGTPSARIWTLRVRGGAIEDNRQGGLDLVDNVVGVSLEGVHFERNKQGNRGATPPVIGYHVILANGQTSTIRGVSIVGCVFGNILGTGGTGFDIWIRNAEGVFMAGNHHTGSATKAVKMDPTGVVKNIRMPALYDDIYGVTTQLPRSGSSTFNGTTGRVITHNIDPIYASDYVVNVIPTAPIAGRWHIVKAAGSFTVFSTSPDAGSFDWAIIEDSI